MKAASVFAADAELAEEKGKIWVDFCGLQDGLPAQRMICWANWNKLYIKGHIVGSDCLSSRKGAPTFPRAPEGNGQRAWQQARAGHRVSPAAHGQQLGSAPAWWPPAQSAVRRQAQGEGRKPGWQGKAGTGEGAGEAQPPAAQLWQGPKEAAPIRSPREGEVMNQVHTGSPVSSKRSQGHR